MFDDPHGVLDAWAWRIVRSFFNPPREMVDDGFVFASEDFFDFSSSRGIVGGETRRGATASGFYSGRPACLVWAADESEGEGDYWRASVMVSSGLGFDESVVVTVTDSHGEGIDAATLILLNSTLEVSDGIASYSLAEFRRNLANTNVALIYPDGRRIPGGFRLS